MIIPTCLATQKSVRLQAYAGRHAENCGLVVNDAVDGWGRQVGVDIARKVPRVLTSAVLAIADIVSGTLLRAVVVRETAD